MQVEAPTSIKPLTEQAAKEALTWGARFTEVESRVWSLSRATEAVQRGDPPYSRALAKWQIAFDALAPFIEEPPAPAAASEKNIGNGRGRGGRPPNDEDLARELLAGWKAFEPEEGRKTKDRYLAQRPDVRVLKTEEARQRKIASLLVALDSALHLQREKKNQKRRARG
jgi:hypothetical protein